MNAEPRRKLTRGEINLLKHQTRFAAIGFPVVVPRKLSVAVLPLWRLYLIEIWYRQDRDSIGGRRTQFISLTVDGHKRIHALLSRKPASKSRRLAGASQGRSHGDDQPSEPQQDTEV